MAPLHHYRDDSSSWSVASPISVAASLSAIHFLIEKQLLLTTTSHQQTLSSTSSASSGYGTPSVTAETVECVQTKKKRLGILRSRTKLPSHWPLALVCSGIHKAADDIDECSSCYSFSRNNSVHFPPSDSMITATHTRPKTHILDLRTLHYSDYEIRRFKREDKREKKAERAQEQEDSLSSPVKVVRRRDTVVNNPSSARHDATAKNSSLDPLKGGIPLPPMNNDSDESSGEEGDDATPESATPTLSLPPSTITVTDAYSLSSIASEVACEALKRLNGHITHSESNIKEPAVNSAPSHWIHCTSFNG